ncbi:hypothetical protein E4T52_10166 [Aureobasidium sp. EXF-3400]|nr:hypothetical protein E4T51_09180 [Aureobasidium sp. EXF-12344]KAI4774876.1 hypothetical protein E4T52_10166 [Aureobasidium sp. EXF-3400]
MANTNNTSDPLEDIMVHPALRKATDLVPAEPWISAMASINALVKDGLTKDLLLVFEGEADGVRRYNGFDDLWDRKGDCTVRIDNQDVSFDSNIIFGTKSEYLISLISECVCEKGKHYHFKVPPLGEDMEKVERYNLAIRNFIATVIRKPIVGCSLVSALKDLQIIAKHIFKLQYPERAAGFVRDHVRELSLDNFANRPADIGKFLAWTEEIRWSRAFVETFAHCVGMLNCGVLDHESLDAVSPTTRALLEHSSTHMHYRLTSAELHMAAFGIDSIIQGELKNHPGVRKSLLAFQDFLQKHYAQVYGTWPPPVHRNSGHWLTRSVAQRLQQDFGDLYDLLVDQTLRSGVATPAHADFFDCTLDRRQLFASWDRQNGFTSLPYSDPKAPDHSPTKIVEQEEEKGARRSSLIPAVQKHRKKAPDLCNIYTRATSTETHISAFCKAFLNHEASTKHQQMNTHEGRLGRWIIIYCIMQLLSKVAVDIQGLRYTSGVEYHLSADTDGTPPWDPSDFPTTMRPAGTEYSWAALFARANGTPHSVSGTVQKKSTKARFKVVHLPDGRVMLEDPDGHVVFR